jgi:hypothetical protein
LVELRPRFVFSDVASQEATPTRKDRTVRDEERRNCDDQPATDAGISAGTMDTVSDIEAYRARSHSGANPDAMDHARGRSSGTS